MPQQRPLPHTSVLVNGDEHPLGEGCSVHGLLVDLGLAGKRVAVAVNREVVPRSAYGALTLRSGDRVEILEAVGGG